MECILETIETMRKQGKKVKQESILPNFIFWFSLLRAFSVWKIKKIIQLIQMSILRRNKFGRIDSRNDPSKSEIVVQSWMRLARSRWSKILTAGRSGSSATSPRPPRRSPIPVTTFSSWMRLIGKSLTTGDRTNLAMGWIGKNNTF